MVLLEGPSDVAAAAALATARRLDPTAHGYRLVDMAGVTNTGRHLAAAHLAGTPVLGLCDAGEVGVVVAALRWHGARVRDAADLPAAGWQVCDRDLEDELIRALTPERVLAALSGLGLAERFATFQQQPAWAGRPLGDQLRRFAGAGSGRKVLLAGALAVLVADAAPPPLAALLDDLAETVRSAAG